HSVLHSFPTRRSSDLEQLLASAEYHQDLVGRIYERYLDRTLDDFGRIAWVGLKDSGATDELVLSAILGELHVHEFYDKTLDGGRSEEHTSELQSPCNL